MPVGEGNGSEGKDGPSLGTTDAANDIDGDVHSKTRPPTVSRSSCDPDSIWVHAAGVSSVLTVDNLMISPLTRVLASSRKPRRL